ESLLKQIKPDILTVNELMLLLESAHHKRDDHIFSEPARKLGIDSPSPTVDMSLLRPDFDILARREALSSESVDELWAFFTKAVAGGTSAYDLRKATQNNLSMLSTTMRSMTVAAGTSQIPELHMDKAEAAQRAKVAFAEHGVEWDGNLRDYVDLLGERQSLFKMATWLSRVGSSNIKEMLQKSGNLVGISPPDLSLDMSQIDENSEVTLKKAYTKMTPELQTLVHAVLKNGADVYEVQYALRNVHREGVQSAFERRNIKIPSGVVVPHTPWNKGAITTKFKDSFRTMWTPEVAAWMDKALDKAIADGKLENNDVYSYSLPGLMNTLAKRLAIPVFDRG
ncbi:hypothetical protein KAI87_12275, partial [Myxococcota bacterium]|nr:hypothetical protein [Myxococcota bacterium]